MSVEILLGTLCVLLAIGGWRGRRWERDVEARLGELEDFMEERR